MYNIIPTLFGRENITYSFRDTDSIVYKVKNCSYEKCSKVLKENIQYFNKELGLMENEINENINEVISLRSKSNSIQKVSDINIKFDNNHKLRKSKGIQKNYCKRYHTHEYFRKILFNEINMKKAEYYKISLKDIYQKSYYSAQLQDDNNVNDIVKSMETELDQKLIVRKISKDNRKKNLCKEEWEGLRWLTRMNNEGKLTIVQADKGGAIIVINPDT